MIRIQLTAGTGPRECAYVVNKVLEKICDELTELGIAFVVASRSAVKGSGPPGLQSAVVEISGKGAENFARGWLGTVLWTGQSPYRPTHKRKNWYIAVHEMELKEAHFKADGAISFQTMRSQGPGGQNVNKTNSAVRAVHLESGISVSARESRSQVQNRKIAQQKIAEIMRDKNSAVENENDDRKWRSQLEVSRGNPVRAFKGYAFIEVAG